jgi:hypothetical protein
MFINLTLAQGALKFGADGYNLLARLQRNCITKEENGAKGTDC